MDILTFVALVIGPGSGGVGRDEAWAILAANRE